MRLSRVLEKHNVLQRYKNWYVLDDEFSWNLEILYHTIFRHLDSRYQVPVIFCSIREANKIISDLGDEEEEYLRFASAIYWRESRIIFIFDYDEYIPLIKTLFHEFRHVMQASALILDIISILTENYLTKNVLLKWMLSNSQKTRPLNIYNYSYLWIHSIPLSYFLTFGSTLSPGINYIKILIRSGIVF